MKKLIFVTSNKHKEREINTVLSAYGVQIKRKQLNIQEPDLGSLEKVAEIKAKQAFEQLGVPLIVEDTGVYFNAYNEFPGLFAKRIFLGIGLSGLLKLLEGKKRTGYFKVAITYIWSKGKYKTFVGKLEGKFDKKIHNKNAPVLPYEKLFIPKGKKLALAETPREEKNSFSHRAIATNKFGKWYKKNVLKK